MSNNAETDKSYNEFSDYLENKKLKVQMRPFQAIDKLSNKILWFEK